MSQKKPTGSLNHEGEDLGANKTPHGRTRLRVASGLPQQDLHYTLKDLNPGIKHELGKIDAAKAEPAKGIKERKSGNGIPPRLVEYIQRDFGEKVLEWMCTTDDRRKNTTLIGENNTVKRLLGDQIIRPGQGERAKINRDWIDDSVIKDELPDDGIVTIKELHLLTNENGPFKHIQDPIVIVSFTGKSGNIIHLPIPFLSAIEQNHLQ